VVVVATDLILEEWEGILVSQLEAVEAVMEGVTGVVVIEL
jgi:hypothetical protein